MPSYSNWMKQTPAIRATDNLWDVASDWDGHQPGERSVRPQPLSRVSQVGDRRGAKDASRTYYNIRQKPTGMVACAPAARPDSGVVARSGSVKGDAAFHWYFEQVT